MKLIARICILTICLCACLPLRAQNQIVEIKGTVMDDDGLPAMSIVIRDKTAEGKVYGITDLDGNFKIMADPLTSLHLSGLTYAPKVVKLNGKRQISVVMSFESRQLSEVVITAKRIVQKITPEPTDIEIVGNQYIIRPKVNIPKKLFEPDCRIIVQPVLVNVTKGTERLFHPAVVTGKKYAITLERMLEFNPSNDPLHQYYTKSKRVDDCEMIAYTDSLYLENPDDECRCDIFIYLMKYTRTAYQDTVVIAKGTVNPMRFFDPKIAARHIADKKYLPRPKKQMRGDQGQVNLTFIVNTANIDYSVPENAVELNKMREKLRTIENDAGSEFTSFSVTGISSPEGLYAGNLRLAQRRTQTAKETIFGFLDPITVMALKDSITTGARVESWEQVAKLMEKDSLSAEGIREVAEKYPGNLDAQYAQISRLPEYQRDIKEKYLKLLRRVEYSYKYSVLRQLNDTEIEQIYKRNYKDLAQYEFWRMLVNARTKSEKEKICRQALEVYPDFMFIANELAVILIEKGEPDASLLKPFANTLAPLELLCNHIIALLHEREYEQVNTIASLLPKSPVTEDILAISKGFSGNYQDAYDYFKPQGGTNEVVLLLALRRDEEAFDKAVELPDDTLVYYLRATAANRLEKLTEASVYLKRAISGDSKYRDIARNDGDLADLLQQMEANEKEKEEISAQEAFGSVEKGKAGRKQNKKRKNREDGK